MESVRRGDPGRTAVNVMGLLALGLLLISLVLSGVVAWSDDPGDLGTWRNGVGAVGGLLMSMWGVAMTYGFRGSKAR